MMKTVVRTHVGKRRGENQDAVAAFRIDKNRTTLIACDGMGGPGGGAIAADVALKTTAHWLMFHPDDEAMSEILLRDAALEAHNRVRLASSLHGISGMGTTLVGAIVVAEGSGTRAVVANIGDSRAYLFRCGQLKQITVDHSVVAELVAAGRITEEQARCHPHRNHITRCVGGHDNRPDVFTIDLQRQDVLLLCTDGLHGMIEDARIADVLSSAPTIEEAADALISAALDAGGADNVTVALWCRDGDR